MALEDPPALPAPPGAPTVDVWPHPLTSEGRSQAYGREGATVSELIREAALSNRPVRAWIDGEEVPAELIPARTLRAGEIVTLRADVAGGGGRKILRTLLSIAVIAASVFIPAAFQLTGLSAAFASAGVMVAGNLLINALVPPELPRLDAPGAERAAPVYSLSGGANRARPYAPLPIVLGEHRIFPDLAAAEYSTFDDGEQYLHQIFDWGLGDITVSDLKSGQNPLSGFSGVNEYWALGGGAITAIAGNVDTSAGADLTDTSWVRRVASNCGSFSVDFVGRIFRINDKGETIQHEVTVEVRWSAPGVQAQTRQLTLTSETQTQLRKTITVDGLAVRDWTVEVRRTTEPVDKEADDATQEDDRTYDDVAFTSMRAFQPDTGTYAGRNRLGLRFQASAQLQGRLDRISGVVRQKVPVWDAVNEVWTAPRYSSNPAWIYRWWARGIFVDGQLVAGRGLAPGRIDDEVIKAWGAWCDTEQLTCNAVIRDDDVEDVIQLIARCGRASRSWQTGKLGVVWDQGNRTPVGMITPGNILQGTFGVEWLDSQLADEVVVRYIEPDMDWQWNSIRRTVPGVTGTPRSSTTVTMRGVTSTRQAASMAGLLAASHKEHRRRVVWDMAAEGLAIRRGNVVWVMHSLIASGTDVGRLKGGTTNEVQLDKQVTLPAGQNFLMLRGADGELHTSAVTAPQGVTGPTDRLVLATPLSEAPDGLDAPWDVLWRFYDSRKPPRKFKVISAEPIDDRSVRFVAIDESAAYYAAANQSQGVNYAEQGLPRVVWISAARRWVRAGTGNVLEVEVVLTVAGRWEGGQVRVGRGTAESVRVVKELNHDDLTARWIEEPRGEISITVIPRYAGGLHLAGAMTLDEFDLVDGLYDIAAPTAFSVTELDDGTRQFNCTPPEDRDLAGIVIRYLGAPDDNSDPAWGAMMPLHDGVLTSFPYETNSIGQGDFVFGARALSTAGDLSAVVRASATFGSARIGAARWHTGITDPDDAIGNNGDFFLNTENQQLWQKVGDSWSMVADLSQADSSRWFTGSAVPGNTVGEDGDFFLVTGSGVLAGTVYTKVSGAWVKQFDIDNGTDGATWLSGESAPAAADGKVGDFYFRTSNGFVYQKTATNTWTFLRDITGPQGIAGTRWHNGTGDPGAALGDDGEYYLNISNNTLWQKGSTGWTQIVDLSQADTSAWLSGSTAPDNADGEDGDFYLQTGSGPLAGTVYRKASGAWVKEFDIDNGADGATWHTAAGAPGNNLGTVGDFYFRSSNGFVYQKTGETAWTFLHDITGPAGIAGTRWHNGTGNPAADLGAAGEYYLNTSTQTLWQKGASAWSQIVDLSQADTSSWHVVTGVPPANLGENGDFAISVS